MKKFLKTKFNKCLLWNTISIINLVLWLVLLFYFYTNIQPFPERYTIAEMTLEMLTMGQGNSLFLIYSLLSLTIISFVSTIISNVVMSILLFSTYDLRIKKVASDSSIWSTIFYNFFYILFIVLYNILFIVLVWYVWLIALKNTYQWKSNYFILNRIKINNYSYNFKKYFYIFFSILVPVSIFSSITAVTLSSNKNLLSHLISNNNVKKYLNLSNNNNNVMFLYFDRTQGVAWNLLLKIDQMINKEKSFISLFPEFCSYTNVISNSSLTKISNPSIYSGPLFNVVMKDALGKSINMQHDTNVDLTENAWYFYALYNLSSMLKANNVSNITFNNLPFYGHNKADWFFGNMPQLEKDMKKMNMDINVMTNAKIYNHVLNKDIKLFQPSNIIDSYVLEELPNLLSFSPNNESSYFSFFSQSTHETYVAKKDGKIQSVNDPEYFIDSMWTVIQQLKGLFSRLKNEAFLDKNGQPMYDKNNNLISVYDKTLIFVLSDHGYNVKKLNKFNSITNYLSQNNILSFNDVTKINEFNYHNIIPILNIKKYKYNIDNDIIHNENHFTFNNDQVLSLEDIPIIMENYLNEYNKTNLESFFIGDKFLKHFDAKYQEILKKQSLTNPLDVNSNSLKNKVLLNRKFSIMSTYDWRFNVNSTTFEIASEQEWNMENTNFNFWNNDNYRLIKKYH